SVDPNKESNIRGGLVRAVAYGGGTKTICGVTFTSYGHVTLQRRNAGTSTFTEFDVYLLRQPLVTATNTLMPLSLPRPGLSYGLYDLWKAVLDTRILVIGTFPFAPYQVSNWFILSDGNRWGNSLSQ